MKKNLVVLLLVLVVVSFGLFAADPESVGFVVKTEVSGINLMKITAAEFAGTTSTAFGTAAAYTGPLTVTASGSQSFSAYLSTMSNNRNGYTVAMSATAMKSELEDSADSYINYTVGVNTKSIKTNGATAVDPVNVIESGTLTGLAAQSHQISLSVDATSFAVAVEGNYTGTITFAYTAN